MLSINPLHYLISLCPRHSILKDTVLVELLFSCVKYYFLVSRDKNAFKAVISHSFNSSGDALWVSCLGDDSLIRAATNLQNNQSVILQIIFTIHWLIIQSIKCRVIVENAYHSFPEPKVSSFKLPRCIPNPKVNLRHKWPLTISCKMAEIARAVIRWTRNSLMKSTRDQTLSQA